MFTYILTLNFREKKNRINNKTYKNRCFEWKAFYWLFLLIVRTQHAHINGISALCLLRTYFSYFIFFFNFLFFCVVLPNRIACCTSNASWRWHNRSSECQLNNIPLIHTYMAIKQEQTTVLTHFCVNYFQNALFPRNNVFVFQFVIGCVWCVLFYYFSCVLLLSSLISFSRAISACLIIISDLT